MKFLLLFWIIFYFGSLQRTQSLKFVDLSYTIGNSTNIWGGHRKYSRGVETEGYTRQGNWLAEYSYTMSEHTSTHMDAPKHVYREGGPIKDLWVLKDVPMSRLLNVPAVKIDLSHLVFPQGKGRNERENYAVSKKDLLEWEKKNGKIGGGSVVFIRTGWDTKWFEGPESFLGVKEKLENETMAKSLYPGVGFSGAKFLANERKVIGAAIDTVSLDPGYSTSFPAHVTFSINNIFMMENVANLAQVPNRFRVWIFPIRLNHKAGSGSPVRVYAII